MRKVWRYGKTFHMEAEPTARAAARAGVNVQKFHRLVARLGITPVLEAEGRTGAKFWAPADVDRIAELVAVEQTQVAS